MPQTLHRSAAEGCPSRYAVFLRRAERLSRRLAVSAANPNDSCAIVRWGSFHSIYGLAPLTFDLVPTGEKAFQLPRSMQRNWQQPRIADEIIVSRQNRHLAARASRAYQEISVRALYAAGTAQVEKPCGFFVVLAVQNQIRKGT